MSGARAREKCDTCGRSFCGDSDHLDDARSATVGAGTVRACFYCIGVGRAKRLERAS